MRRRKFLNWTGYLLMLPFVYLVGKMLKKNSEHQVPHSIVLTPPDPGNILIHGAVIVINDDKSQNLRVFSSHCTHLGCRISQVREGLLACPCHGSRFDLNGTPKSGPANSPLKSLAYTINDLSGEMTIML